MGRRRIGQEVMGFVRAERRRALDELAAAIDWGRIENWLEATRYLNMAHLAEHKKEEMRKLEEAEAA